MTAIPRAGSKLTVGDGISVSVQDADSTPCSRDSAIVGASKSPQPITAWGARELLQGRGACHGAGTYYVIVERTRTRAGASAGTGAGTNAGTDAGAGSGTRAAAGEEPWELEIAPVSEPALTKAVATSVPEEWDSATPTPPTGAPVAVRGGAGFAKATAVDQGVWRDEIVPGQTLFYTADLTATPAPAGDLKSQAAWYAAEGYKVDDLALRAIAAATTAADRDAVCKALKGIYDPWVEEAARTFQSAAVAGYKGETGLDVPAGTCVVFVDALRFDLGQRLAKRLASLEVSVSPRLAAFPTVTPTGQPAVAPVAAGFGAGQAFDAADAQGRSVKGQVFRSALADAGVQYLDWKAGETGDVNKIGWTQTNTIDALGHDHGHALADMLDQQLDLVAERIQGLLAAGWRRVVVVTDHGFVMPAAPALKVELPLAVTEGDAARKPRVARLKAGAARPDFPIVDWTWGISIEMVSAPGAAAFEAGTIYEHGGLSHQECVIPVIEITASAGDSGPAQIAGIRWTGQRCRIDFEPAEADVVAEVRLAPATPRRRSAVRSRRRSPERSRCSSTRRKPPRGRRRTSFFCRLTAPSSLNARRRWEAPHDRHDHARRDRRAGGIGLRRLHRPQGPRAAVQGRLPGADLRRRVPARPLLRQHRSERRSRRASQIVERQLRDRTVRAGEEELFKARARERGTVKLIDIVTARLDAKTDSYLAELPSLQLKDVRIDDAARRATTSGC